MGKFLAKLKRDESMLRGEKADFLFTSPSPGVNYLFGRKGGIKPGYSTLIYGPPKSGKSLFAFAFAGQLHQNDPEAIVMYFDTEYRDNAETWYKPFGIDPDRFISRQTNDPVQIFDYIVNEVKAAIQEGEKIKMIIIDSLAMIRFPKEANKELSTDMVIGDGAAYLTGAMKLIIPTIRQNNIALILCQHVRMNMNPQSAKYHPYVIPGGIALKHSVEYWLYCEKINGKDTKIGRAHV
jgi:RecA/RadA recombinase